MVSIGGVPVSGKLCLAPMAGVADAAFRAVCRGEGAAYAVSEMISAKALMLQDAKTRTLLRRFPEDTPLGVQLFGSEPDTMADAVRKARDISGCEIIDVNMGCPVGKVVRNGEGSALMRDLTLAGRILDAVVKASDVPVTVKFRKGWDGGSVNAVELAKLAESVGVAALCVHGRTRTQFYSGRADWEIIRDVKASVSIPVIANGDVFEPEDVPRIFKVTGADLVMIGRGAMGNPWIFSQINSFLATGETPEAPTVEDKMRMMLLHAKKICKYKGEKIGICEARKHALWYVKGIRGAAQLRNRFSTLHDLQELTLLAEEVCNAGSAAEAQ